LVVFLIWSSGDISILFWLYVCLWIASRIIFLIGIIIWFPYI
jgi:hypothetical protein